MPDQAAKTCIWCKQDCSSKPRQKDLKGNYLCKECVEPYQQALTARAKQRRPERTPTTPVPSDSAIGTGDVLVGMIDQTVAAQGEACPSCSRMLPQDAVICTHCGYNKNSGRQMRSHVEMLKREKGESKTVAAASAVADTAMVSLLIGTVASLVGAAIGGGIWGFIAYKTGYEFSAISILVGVAAGGGMMLGARDHAGMTTAIISAVIALTSILTARYVVVSYIVDEMVVEQGITTANDQDAMVYLADQIVYRKESQHIDLVWPQDSTIETAYYEEDYPTGIWAEAQTQWDAMDAAGRADTLALAQIELDNQIADFKDWGFFASIGIGGFVFMGIGVIAAFGAGSGGSFE